MWEEKQLYGRFKRLTSDTSHEITRTLQRKGNPKRKTKYLQNVAQNSVIMSNNIKARIDKTQEKSRCRLCGDRDETINHIISKYSKLAQKEYKTRHERMGNMILRELCQKLKFHIGTNSI